MLGFFFILCRCFHSISVCTCVCDCVSCGIIHRLSIWLEYSVSYSKLSIFSQTSFSNFNIGCHIIVFRFPQMTIKYCCHLDASNNYIQSIAMECNHCNHCISYWTPCTLFLCSCFYFISKRIAILFHEEKNKNRNEWKNSFILSKAQLSMLLPVRCHLSLVIYR